MESEPAKTEALSKEEIVLTFSIAHIADDRMACVLQVQPDLVAATGAGSRFVESIALE